MPLYLHGFASGPLSTKAQFFRARMAEHGVALDIPDLAPDFTHMTISSQLGIIADALAGRVPEIVLGSSLGGYLAALVATQQPQAVRALVVFAPAVDFANRWETRLGSAAMAAWRTEGTTEVFHYGRDRNEPLSIALLDDARRYPGVPDPRVPTLVFAGRHDDAVPLDAVERFAAARPERELVVYDSGHELTDVLEPMWDRTRAFLQQLSPPGL